MLYRSMLVPKILLLSLLLIYINYFEISQTSNVFDAITVLIISIFLFIRNRKNMLLVILFLFIFYSNYSVIMGEYFIGGSLGVPFTEVKNTNYYGIAIRTLLLFMAVIFLFLKVEKDQTRIINIIPKDNLFIFYSLILFLVYILIFQVERNGDFQSYSVRITSLYEYSKLLFLFAFYYHGGSMIRKGVFITILFLFVLQDFYYGGRITSLQLIILLCITFYGNKLTFKKIIYYGFSGIFLIGFVGAYRGSSLGNISDFYRIIKTTFNNFFVFDTPVFAYYASATHVAAFEIAGDYERWRSFWEFIKSLFVGYRDIYGNVTALVSTKYFSSLGGGFLQTHFYFWFGWPGVLLIGAIIVLILNNIRTLNSDFKKLLFASIIISVPRWFLYSPSTLFRGSMIIFIFLYLTLVFVNHITSKKRIKSEDIV